MLMFGWIMFCKIIGEIFLTTSLVYKIVDLFESVTKPIKMYVYDPVLAFLEVIID